MLAVPGHGHVSTKIAWRDVAGTHKDGEINRGDWSALGPRQGRSSSSKTTLRGEADPTSSEVLKRPQPRSHAGGISISSNEGR